ncbi:hypothetical protein Q4596_02145 [Pseudoalteromonas carrageenovora]|uniref:hypothetical protein n=1 Tax=Pseudoalteromonas carrageenovora TaxID=227 RepID=UPI0026E11533|nr:hypothetical protein [Pseudoalteromonas carrageenovora]MDO6834402.1 hypothetical protein [Pseudoalteromonas carrageenovora]
MLNNTHTICDFGLHKGEAYTKLPTSFLTWMISTKHRQSEYAHTELKRRERAVINNLALKTK